MNTKIITYSKAKESFFLAQEVEGKSERTIELYEQSLKFFERFLLGKNPLEVEGNDIRRFIFHLKDKNYAKGTIYNHIKELRVFYRFLTEERLIEKNPTESIKQIHVPKRFPYCPTDEDVRLLIAQTKGKNFEQKRNYCLLTLFISTGIRVSEACNLTLDNINLASFSLRIRGKGDKERVVLFDKKAAKALNSYLKARLSRNNASFEDALFIGSKRGEPMTRKAILKIVHRLSKKAKLRRRIFPHALRHYFATRYLRAGGSVFALQKLLGHSALATTSVYLSLTAKDLRDDYFKTFQSLGR